MLLPQALNRRYGRFYFGILAGALVLLWAGHFMIGYSVEKSAEQSLRVRAQSDALLLEEHLSRTLDSIAGRLASASTARGAAIDARNLLTTAALADLIFANNEVRSISLVDDEGRVLASSSADNVAVRLPPGMLPDVSAAAPGKMLLGGIAPYRDLHGLALAGPPENSGLWLATAPVPGTASALQWVAVINTGFFENFWARLYGEGALRIGVFDYAGSPLVSYFNASLDAQRLGAGLVRRVETADRGLYDDTGNPDLIVAYRSSAVYPLILTVVGDRRLLQAELAGDRRLATWGAVALTVVIALLLWFVYRGYLRYRMLDDRLGDERRRREAAALASEQRRAMEEQLREAQKLEAVGQLTGGLAHDFNNLLGIVVGNLDLIDEGLPPESPLHRQCRTALEAALRGAEVTRSLLAVARRQPLQVARYDVNVLVNEMRPLLMASVGAAVALELDLAPGPIHAHLDAAGLSNAVLNLVINARDALRAKGGVAHITIRTRLEVLGEHNHENLAWGGYAVLEVVDNGSGMSKAVREQAFEPFFTTKERGSGTGLGLAMVYGYAQQLGGTAQIDSIEGVGTTVRLYLPLDDDEAGARPTVTEMLPQGSAAAVPAAGAPAGETPILAPTTVMAPAASAGAALAAALHGASSPVANPDPDPAARLRVLVVDDEPQMCTLAASWIESMGYAADKAYNANHALELLATAHYDVLFTDVVMPGGIDGLELARRALEGYPALRVLLTSGYAQSLFDQGSLPGPILNKPYRKAHLVRSLDQVLRAPRGRHRS